MQSVIRTVLMITKAGDARATALSLEIAQWLSARGVVVHLLENPERCSDKEASFIHSLRGVELDLSLVLVLGGDGTMLSVARRLDYRTPLLGVNMGRVGFLTELCPNNWETGLADVLRHGVRVREHLALEYVVERPGYDGPISKGRVINDLVISRGGLARLVPLQLEVNGVHVSLVRADGLVVSTPIGATGYAVSAGGPLLHPDIEAFSVTAICPFIRGFIPMVLPSDAVLRLQVMETTGDVFMTQDGQQGLCLRNGDVATVRRAEKGFSTVRVNGTSYFDKLRAKGFMNDPNTPPSDPKGDEK